MNIQETLELLKALRESRATHFKSQEIEVSLDLSAHAIAPVISTPVSHTVVQSNPPAPSLDPEAEKAATEKIRGLIATLNMSNEELVNLIFPAGAN